MGRFRVELSTAQKVFCYLLGAVLLFTGTGHLTWARTEFLAQVPNWFSPSKDLVVILSGIFELLLGLSLMFLVRDRVIVGWVAALFFVAIFSGNISQYVHHIDAFGLDSDVKRGVRLLFQPVLVVWALWSTGAWKKRRDLISERFVKNV